MRAFLDGLRRICSERDGRLGLFFSTVVVLFALFGVAATMSGSEFGGTELSG